MVEIDIKVRTDEGKVTSQTLQYQPMAEINLAEAMKRKGWTIPRLADKLGFTPDAVRKMVNGSPSLPTIYKMAWAMDIDPRELFFPMDNNGNIVEEPKQNVQELLDEIERLKQGPLFSRDPQDAQQVLCCPKCATTFLVTNVPTKPLPTE